MTTLALGSSRSREKARERARETNEEQCLRECEDARKGWGMLTMVSDVQNWRWKCNCGRKREIIVVRIVAAMLESGVE